MIIQVKVSLLGSRLECSIATEEHSGKSLYSFELYRIWNEIISEVKDCQDCMATFELPAPGVYFVRASITRGQKKTSRQSRVVEFLPKEIVNDFEAFCTNNSEECLNPLKFAKSSYPLGDYCLFYSNKADTRYSNAFLCLAKDEQMEVFQPERKRFTRKKHECILISSSPVKEKSGIPYFFSGLAKANGKLYSGCKDVQNDAEFTNVSDLKEQIGEFTLITFHDKEVEIDNDYFGVSKTYYFEQDGVIVVSNRYHLLLLALQKMGISLRINKEKVIAGFCHLFQIMQQNFTRDMDIEEIYVLPVDYRMILSNKGIALEKTTLYNEAFFPEEYDAKRYEELLFQAKAEIIENVEIALKHPDYDYMRLDLTGGLDSRIVYAAATNLPDVEGKIRIATGRSSPQDEARISAALNHFYEYPYDDIPTHHIPRGNQGALAALSFHIGTRYYYPHYLSANRMKKTLALTGFYGEICARPYMARTLLNTPIDVDDVDIVLDRYTQYFGKYTVFVDDAFYGKLYDEFDKLPGRTPLEKLDLHYLYYRNGLFCNSIFNAETMSISWGPIQSKIMFHLKNMTFQKFKSIKLQLDILQVLNPLLALVPFENSDKDRNNLEKLRIKDTLFNPTMANMEIQLNEDLENWRTTFDKKAKGIVQVLEAQERELLQQEIRDYPNTYKKLVLSALQKIVHFEGGLFKESVGLHVYAWMQRNYNHDDDATRILTHKVLSLGYQLEMIQR